MKLAAMPKYVVPFLSDLYPNEQFGEPTIPGLIKCPNPKCNYHLGPQDEEEINRNSGWWTCPNCDHTYDFYQGAFERPGGVTRAGLTLKQMGNIGEDIVARLGIIPEVGQVEWVSPDYNNPIDAIVGEYACEIKTNHAESQPRFKLGGALERQAKIEMAQQLGKKPGFIGVRLNFYTDRADLFFYPKFSDFWIGNPGSKHVASVDFSDLNPYKKPEEVPPPNRLPEDDSDDSDIPF